METLVLVPAKATLRQDIYYTYACEHCEKNDISTPSAIWRTDVWS